MNKINKIKATLFALCASLGLVATGVQAEYSQSISGNVRVQSVTTSTGDPAVSTSSIQFGGDEEESATGADTYLQWNHKFEGDDSQATGFVRFTGDSDIRYNVQASSQLGIFSGALKAEWDTKDGFSGAIEERDQFAVLTWDDLGLYYKVGREEWLNNEKGFVTDFQDGGVKSFAGNAQNNRFGAHAIGWKGFGAEAAFLLQQDSASSNTGRALFGDRNYATNETTDVLGFGVRLAYNGAGHGIPLDVQFTFLTGSQNTNVDRGNTLVEQESAGNSMQLYLQAPLGFVQVANVLTGMTPFFNLGTQARTSTVAGVDTVEYSKLGWNVGTTVGLFGFSDLILAYGSKTTEDAKIDNSAATDSGFYLGWATNQDPLKFTFALSQTTASTDTPGSEDVSSLNYGVRMEYGF